jgi:hypothetical protein
MPPRVAGLVCLIDPPSDLPTPLHAPFMPSVGPDSTPAADSNAGRLQLPNSKREPAVSNARACL